MTNSAPCSLILLVNNLGYYNDHNLALPLKNWSKLMLKKKTGKTVKIIIKNKDDAEPYKILLSIQLS